MSIFEQLGSSTAGGNGEPAQQLDELWEVLEHIPGFVGIQLPGNVIKWVNQRGLQLWEKTPEELFGRPCLDVMGCAKEGICDRCPVMRSFETGKPHSGVRRNHKGLLFEVKAVPILGEKGEVRAVLQLGRNVTEEHRLREQLKQAQKLESVGRLASGIAHDFNNLLTGIFGNVSLARINRSRPDQLEEALAEIERAAQGAADLAARLLAFSRKEHYSPRVVDLNRLISAAHRIIERVIGEDVEVVLACDAGITAIHADPTQIEQILLNLAVNARDAMPEGGTLTIGTEQERISPSDSAPFRPGDYVLLTVSDSGCGMDEQTRQHIFDPFFTTKEVGRGTGLGLSTVYEIVQDHEGFIEVESSVGQGARFSLHLPALSRKEEAKASELQTIPLPRGTERVWVVEDEPMVRQLAVETLRKLGYDVQEAENGDEALGLPRRVEAAPELLLTDVVMPKVNGRELAERLLRRYPELKVLFTSGYAANLLGTEDINAPGRGFLPKPYTQTQLARQVRKLLDD